MNSKARELSARIAARVRSLRAERNWSQPELARRSSLSNAMVSMVERGERTPSLEALAALAGALEVDPATLLSTDDDAPHQAGVRRLAEELGQLGLPRADVDALRRIAHALAAEQTSRRRR
jgi:putative transcriptional regulator